MEQRRDGDAPSDLALAVALVLLVSGLVLLWAGGWVLLEVLEHLPTCSGQTCGVGLIFLSLGIGLAVLAIGNVLACIGIVRGSWAGEHLGWFVGPIGLLISAAFVWIWLEFVA